MISCDFSNTLSRSNQRVKSLRTCKWRCPGYVQFVQFLCVSTEFHPFWAHLAHKETQRMWFQSECRVFWLKESVAFVGVETFFSTWFYITTCFCVKWNTHFGRSLLFVSIYEAPSVPWWCIADWHCLRFWWTRVNWWKILNVNVGL